MNKEIRLRDRDTSQSRRRFESKTNFSFDENEYNNFSEKPKVCASNVVQMHNTCTTFDENARHRSRPRTGTSLKVTNIDDVSSKNTNGVNPRREQQSKQYKQSQKRIRRNVSVQKINNLKGTSATFTEKVTKKKPRKSANTASRSAAELPMANILDKTKEMRTLSADITPLRELTADRLYVQRHDTDFSVVKMSRRNTFDSPYVDATRKHPSNPIDISVTIQKFWKCASLINQGLLGGLGLVHFILMQTLFQRNVEFVVTYSKVSEIYTSVFSFLTVMCLVSSLDRYDVAHQRGRDMREICLSASRAAIAIPIYLTMLCLHQTTVRVDDKFSLTRYNATTWTNNNRRDTFLEELGSWQRLTVTKDILAFIAWIFTCIESRADLLLIHLEAMQKSTSTSRKT